MKKSKKSFLGWLLALAMLAALSACGGSASVPVSRTPPPETPAPPAATATHAPTPVPAMTEPKPEPETKPETEPPSAPTITGGKTVMEERAGYYLMTDLMENGKPSEDFAVFDAVGLRFYLVLQADGTGYMESYGEREEIQWNEKTITDPSGAENPYTFNKDIIMMDDEGGNAVVFSRLSGKLLEDYLEHGSGSVDDLISDMDRGDPVSTIPAGEPSGGPVSGDLGLGGQYHVTILGAEKTVDGGGHDALRLWFDFTNNSEQITSPFAQLYCDAIQDQTRLEATEALKGVPEDDYFLLDAAPGKLLRCTALFSYHPEGGVIGFRIGNWTGDGLLFYADPANLSGPPEEEFRFQPDPAMPEYMRELPASDDSAQILAAERFSDENGKDALLITLQFTNQTGKAVSFDDLYFFEVLQDGIALFPAEAAPAGAGGYGNGAEQVRAGETVSFVRAFYLRSDSPVAALFTGNFSQDYFGKMIELP